MTTSKNDTKKSFSAMNNRFLIDIGGVLKVRCLDGKESCACIPLPKFSMYFCENPECSNNLELRYYDKGGFKLHDYGAVFKDAEFQENLGKLMEAQKASVFEGMPEPAKVYDLQDHKKPVE